MLRWIGKLLGWLLLTLLFVSIGWGLASLIREDKSSTPSLPLTAPPFSAPR
jgi:hypothetical protein